MKKVFAVVAALLTVFMLSACGKTAEGLWENSLYTDDTDLGNGKISVQVEVKAGDKSVTFTIHTDKTVLSDALFEHDIISGDEGQYGLYIKTVNGMTADYDTDKSYWALYKSGEMLMTGADSTEIADGEHYELVYSK